MHRFTSEFGMGSGGSNALWPPGKLFEKKGRSQLPSSLVAYSSCREGNLTPTLFFEFGLIDLARLCQLHPDHAWIQRSWALYGQASRAISTG